MYLEDRPLLPKRRTLVYWKEVAGVVVVLLHRQPLPSVWVVLNRNLPLPGGTPNLAISFVNFQPTF